VQGAGGGGVYAQGPALAALSTRRGGYTGEPSSAGKAGATTVGLEVAGGGSRFGAAVKLHLR
jgi:hypothetical protein